MYGGGRNQMTSPFKSPYHFDKFRIDAEGEYSKIIGRFEGDWLQDIVSARDIGVKAQGYNQQDYGHAANKKSEGHVEEDADNPYGNPSAKMFAKLNFDRHPGACPMFERIVDYLQFNTDKKSDQQ